MELVGQHGARKWSLIAQSLPGRIGKQCRYAEMGSASSSVSYLNSNFKF